MFSSAALNVVLGLVLIYLLYSLLCTILSEILSTQLGVRARILRQAIERMLTDGFAPQRKRYFDQKRVRQSKKKERWLLHKWNILDFRVRQVFLRKPPGQKYTLAGRFYNYPSIQYLSKKDRQTHWWPFTNTLPSYISAELFATTLTSMMSDKAEGATPFEELAFCLRYNTLHIDFNTRRQLQDMLSDSGGNVAVFQKKLRDWYNETMDRANGWYKRVIRTLLFFLGLMLASIFNIDSLRIAHLLSNDPQVSQQLANLSVQVSQDTRLRSIQVTPLGDTTSPPTPADSSYSRLSANFKALGEILGSGWDVAAAARPWATTMNMRKDFSKEDSGVITRLADSFQRQQMDIHNTENALVQEKKEVENIRRQYADLYRSYLQNAARSVKVVVPPSRDEYLRRQTAGLAVLHLDSLALRSQRAALDGILAAMTTSLRLQDVKLENIDVKDSLLIISGREVLNTKRKIKFYLYKHPWSAHNIAGFAITALAISLGVSFWFNILVKLASIRGSGVNPDEKKTPPLDEADLAIATEEEKLLSTASQNSRMLPFAANDASAGNTPLQAKWDSAIAEVTRRLASLPGFLCVTRGWDRQPQGQPNAGAKIPAVEVQMRDDQAIAGARQALAGFTSDFPVIYLKNTQALAHGSVPVSGNTVFNDNTTAEFGTLGCFAKSKKNSKAIYFITCWHVLKGDTDYRDNTKKFRDVTIKNCGPAILTDGCLSDKLDVAFAEIKDPAGVENIFSLDFRPVIFQDATDSTEISFRGASTTPGKGFIDLDTTSVSLQYPNGKFYPLSDVIRFCIYDEHFKPHPVSVEGDSGSVIIDGKGQPLGLIVGGDLNYSYAVKFSNFLDPDTGMYKEYALLTDTNKTTTIKPATTNQNDA